MSKDVSEQTFVKAAIVASELHQAMIIAHRLTITAANAKVLSLKAGAAAAGFAALTKQIDELAHKVILISGQVSKIAVLSSRVAADLQRTSSAVDRFKIAQQRANNARYADSFSVAQAQTARSLTDLNTQYEMHIKSLYGELLSVASDLRGANVLATMSRVEATLVDPEHAQALRDIADSVATASDEINRHVRHSIKLISA